MQVPRPAQLGPQFEKQSAEVLEIACRSEDDWHEERDRQARALNAALNRPPQAAASSVAVIPPAGMFSEFRRKLASGEAVSRATEKLAAALHFSGRITVTFHQGKVTKTVLEENYFRRGGAV